ncbi:MAG TPA: hypothetical protein VII56_04845 [Rhizomicrobium sp.]
MTTKIAAAAPPSTLSQLVLTWVPFSLGMTFVILGAVIAPDVPHARTQYSIRLALLLAAPALFLFARDFRRRELGALWKSYWTAAFAAYAFHLWYGYEIMFRGDWAAVVASQGEATALINLAITALWAVDIGCAWLDLKGRIVDIIRAVAHVGLLAAAVMATMLFFRNNIAAGIGGIVTLAAVAGLIQRLRTT